MPEIDIVYDSDCPNIEETRRVVREALSLLGLSSAWREWKRSSPDTPEYLRGYGSPTILVDGRDVARMPQADGSCCRLYRDDQGGLSGVPPLRLVVDALVGRPRG